MRAIALLLGVGFLDELAGVAYPSAPAIQDGLGISYAAAALALFTVPQLAATVVEPPLLVLASRAPRKPLVVLGLLVMGAALIGCGLADGPWALGALMIAVWLGSGFGVTLSEATLLDADLTRQPQRMARWTLLGSLGDLCAPLLVAALSAAAFGWREGFFVVGAVVALYALLLARVRFPPPQAVDEDADDEEPTLRAAVGAALGNRRLLWWLLGAELCSLLDEVFVAFGSLYLSTRYGASLAEIGVAMAAMMVGSVAGLVLLERRLAAGADADRLLRRASAACAVMVVVWLSAPSVWWSTAALVLLGASIAPQWPLATARAHRELPGQAAMVSAVGGLFTPLGIVLPLLVGLLADRVGLSVALLVMLAQPLGLLVLAMQHREPSAV